MVCKIKFSTVLCVDKVKGVGMREKYSMATET